MADDVLDKAFLVLLAIVMGFGCGLTAPSCEVNYQILVEMEEEWE